MDSHSSLMKADKSLQPNEDFRFKGNVSDGIGPGIHYSQYNLSNDKLLESVHHMEIDLENQYIQLMVMSPNGKVGKLGTVREIMGQIKSQNKDVVLAVNGDFFSHLGVPSGLQIVNGKVITSPPITKVLMAVKNDNSVIFAEDITMLATISTDRKEKLHIDSINRTRNLRDMNHAFLYNSCFRDSTKTPEGGLEVVISLDEVNDKLVPCKEIKGYVKSLEETSNTRIESGHIVLSTTGEKSKWIKEHLYHGANVTLNVSFNKGINDANQVISGNSTLGFSLLKKGIVAEEIKDSNNRYRMDRHPRTILATKDDKLHIFVFDGRQPGYSDGITMEEGANYLKSLGMENAINIDGGGSTTCFIRKAGEYQPSLVNRPSDGFEREVGNVLLLISVAPLSDLNKLVTFPSKSLKILVNSQINIQLKGHDKNYNAVDLIMDEVNWTEKGSIGHVDNNGLLKAGTKPGTGKILIHYNNIETGIDIEVTNQISRLIMNPDSIVIEPEGTVDFDISAYDEDGERIWVSPEQLTWSIQEDIGIISSKGKFHATEKVLSGKVIAKYNGVQAECSVNIGQPPLVVTEFETLDKMRITKLNVVPNSVVFTQVARPLPVRYGTFAAKLAYDFTGMSGVSKVSVNFLDESNQFGRVIRGEPYRFGVWVYGDSNCHWLRLGVSDANGQSQSLNFTEVGGLNWTGWKYVYADVPVKMAFPLKVLSLYILETNDANKNAGVIYFDKFQAEYVNLNEDVEGPIFNDLTPKNKLKYVGRPVEISAVVSDLDSGIDQSSIRMWINGDVVEHKYDPDNGEISYQIVNDLFNKVFHIVIEASDNVGNPSVPNADWKFEVI